jgi:hypothetical protein
MMEHPYKNFESTKLWSILMKSINELVENNDIDERTPREYIVGYLCKQIEENSIK